MNVRGLATALATLTLLAALTVGVLIAAPSIALALQPAPAPTTAARPAAGRSAPAPAPPTTTSSPAPAYRGPLIAPLGSQRITRQQLHAWVASRPFFGDDPDDDAIWEEQQWLDIRCMARKGFLDDPTNPALQDHGVSTADGLTAQQAQDYAAAMDGPPTEAPYDWRAAGCHGRSVHVTGQDDAH